MPCPRRRCAAVLVLAAVTLADPAPASAHAALIGSDPPAGATLPAGPARVSATFSEDLRPDFAAMTVVGPDNRLWSAGEPRVSGAVASVELRPLAGPGRYTVNYRVTSADDHVVSGSWSFTVTGSGTPAPGPAAGAPDAIRPPASVPWWPFALGAAVLVTPAVVWALRRRS